MSLNQHKIKSKESEKERRGRSHGHGNLLKFQLIMADLVNCVTDIVQSVEEYFNFKSFHRTTDVVVSEEVE